MSDNFIIDDSEEDRTRTLVLDIPMPDLLHALFKSEAYMWHTRFRIDVDVALLTDDGLKTAKIVPHDGDMSPNTLEDFIVDESEPETPEPHDKAAATFVAYDDWPRLNAAADELLQIAREAPIYSR